MTETSATLPYAHDPIWLQLRREISSLRDSIQSTYAGLGMPSHRYAGISLPDYLALRGPAAYGSQQRIVSAQEQELLAWAHTQAQSDLDYANSMDSDSLDHGLAPWSDDEDGDAGATDDGDDDAIEVASITHSEASLPALEEPLVLERAESDVVVVVKGAEPAEAESVRPAKKSVGSRKGKKGGASTRRRRRKRRLKVPDALTSAPAAAPVAVASDGGDAEDDGAKASPQQAKPVALLESLGDSDASVSAASEGKSKDKGKADHEAMQVAEDDTTDLSDTAEADSESIGTLRAARHTGRAPRRIDDTPVKSDDAADRSTSSGSADAAKAEADSGRSPPRPSPGQYHFATDAPQFRQDVKLWKQSPDKCFDALRGHGFLSEDSWECKAAFISCMREQLDNKKTIDWLTHEDNVVCLTELFHRDLSFAGLDVDISLRQLLFYLGYLPGEGQRIGRVTHAFGAKYVGDNPDCPIASGEAAASLTHSMVMLNTILYSQQAAAAGPGNLGFDDFTAELAGRNDGQDFDSSFLLDIYQHLQELELKFYDETPFPDAHRRGFLMYRTVSGTLSRWKRAWFVLTHGVLFKLRKLPKCKAGAGRQTLPKDVLKMAGATLDANVDMDKPAIRLDAVNNKGKKQSLLLHSENSYTLRRWYRVLCKAASDGAGKE